MSAARGTADPARRQRRAADPGASAWVAASAGSGKTRVLVDRVVRLLLEGASPERILCLTYTRAAAAEMANRIREVLGEWAATEDETLARMIADLTGSEPDEDRRSEARRLFARVLDAPGGLKIETIHGFCQSLLRRFPLEAGIAPHFEVLDERTSGEILHAAREEVLGRARDGRGDGLDAALDVLTLHLEEEAFASLTGKLARERSRIGRLEEKHGGIGGVLDRLYRDLGIGSGETPEKVIEGACEDSAFDGAALRRAAAALAGGSKTDRERAGGILSWLAEPDRRAERFDEYARIFLTQKLGLRERLATKKVQEESPETLSVLAAEAERLRAAHRRRNAATVARATAALLVFGEAVLDTYERHKAERGALDYEDLILRARRLLEDAGAAWILYKLDGGLDHVLIDEAQDTSPDQWEVVRALTDEFFAGEGAREIDRTVFAVGDAKQSIYSFQGADPRAFEEMRRCFAGRARAAGKRWEDVYLGLSYRSTDAVLRLVDAVFAEEDARDGVAASGREIRHEPVRVGRAGRVELWPPVGPEEATPVEGWEPPLRAEHRLSPAARLARLVATRIRGWLDRKEILESKGRPVRAADVMVLVRRRTEFVDALVRALKERGVGVSGVDRMVFTNQLAVMDLVALGEFLLLPEDDLTLATVLKGPLVGLTEDRLFALACGRGRRPLWEALGVRRGEAEDFGRAYRLLHDLLGRADYAPPYELFAEILGQRGGRHALLARLGPDAADPLDEFLALALAFERENVPSLQGFLHWLLSSNVEVKRDLERGVRDEVRIMTVHGAKGLEAPIVFLPDTLQVHDRPPALLWGEAGDGPLWSPRTLYDEERCAAAREVARRRDEQEYRRLLYVGLTRAEDRLVVCGWRGKPTPPQGCWYELVARAFARLSGVERFAFDFSGEFREGPLREHVPEALRYSVPQTAETEREHPPPFLEEGEEALPDWAGKPAPAEPLPHRPLAPSRLVEEEPPVRSPLGPDAGEGFLRGRIVHRLLELLPPLSARVRGRACRRYLSLTALGLDRRTRREIEGEVLRLFEDPAVAPLFGVEAEAEVPVAGEVGGEWFSGQIDRLLVTPGEVVAVDYKTNREPPPSAAAVPLAYLRQMAAYRALLRRIYPDRPVRCALLWTVGPRLTPLADDVLDAALA